MSRHFSETTEEERAVLLLFFSLVGIILRFQMLRMLWMWQEEEQYLLI